ncbi:hypothetical protein EDC94DRAFT_650512, partial [Helicostylum pulchrum]
ICDYCGNILTEEDYVTECGHIICRSKCYSNESVCPICKKKCKFVVISGNVPQDATGFLRPIKNIFEDTTNIFNFRLLALRRLIQSQKIRIAKQKDLINQAKEQVSQLKDYKWEIYYLKKENKELRSKLNQSRE